MKITSLLNFLLYPVYFFAEFTKEINVSILTTLGDGTDFFHDPFIGGEAPGGVLTVVRVTTIVMVTYKHSDCTLRICTNSFVPQK